MHCGNLIPSGSREAFKGIRANDNFGVLLEILLTLPLRVCTSYSLWKYFLYANRVYS